MKNADVLAIVGAIFFIGGYTAKDCGVVLLFLGCLFFIGAIVEHHRRR